MLLLKSRGYLLFALALRHRSTCALVAADADAAAAHIGVLMASCARLNSTLRHAIVSAHLPFRRAFRLRLLLVPGRRCRNALQQGNSTGLQLYTPIHHTRASYRRYRSCPSPTNDTGCSLASESVTQWVSTSRPRQWVARRLVSR